MTTAGNATVGNANIYQFINQRGEINAADKNGDGKVSYNEIKAFLEQDFTADEIALFWKDADTAKTGSSRNCLDANEMKVVLCKSEAADQIKKYADEKAKLYFAEIKGALVGLNIEEDAWKELFVSAFNNDAILNGSAKFDPAADDFADKMETYVQGEMNKTMGAALKTATANTVRDAIINGQTDILKDLTDNYGYDISSDKTLNDKIAAILNNIGDIIGADGNIDSDAVSNIQARIEAAVGSYLKLAGIGEYESDGTHTNDEIKNGKKLNDLQRAVLKQKLDDPIKNKVASLVDKYEAFLTNAETTLKNAVDSYVQKVIDGADPSTYFTSSGPIDSAILGILDGLEESEEFKNAVKVASVVELFTKDANGNSKILDALKVLLDDTKDSNDIYDQIKTKDLLENDYIKDLIKSKASKIDVKNFDADKVAKEIAQDIASNVFKYFPQVANKLGVDGVAKIYDNRINGDNAKTADAKAALKEFLDFYYKKTTGDYKTVIDEWFNEQYGSGYTEALKTMGLSDIRTAFDALKSRLEKVVDTDTLKDNLDEANTWGALAGKADKVNNIDAKADDKPLTFTIHQGTSIPAIDISPKFKNGTYIETSKHTISYDPQGNSIFAIDQATGKLKINGTQAGTFDQTISIKVDDKVIATKKIHVVVTADQTNELTEVLKNSNEGFIVDGTKYNFKALLTDAVKTHSVDVDTIDKIVPYIQKFLDGLCTGIKNKFPDYADILEDAKQTTLNYYTAVATISLENLTDDDEGLVGHEFTYYDAKLGKNVPCQDKSARSWTSSGNQDRVDSIGEVAERAGDSETGIYRSWSKAGGWLGPDHHDYCFIDLKVVLEKFLSFI